MSTQNKNEKTAGYKTPETDTHAGQSKVEKDLKPEGKAAEQGAKNGKNTNCR